MTHKVGSITAGTATNPRQCPFDSHRRGRKIAGFEVFSGVADDGVDMLFRVGVDANNVGVYFGDSLRDDGQEVRCSLYFKDRAFGRMRPVPVRE